MAKEFAENARKLREQMEREDQGPESSVEHTGQRPDNFVDAAGFACKNIFVSQNYT